MITLTAKEDRAEWKRMVSLRRTHQMNVEPRVNQTLLTRDHDIDEREAMTE